jgi:predicted AlkP superfamily pyrophosphatase or phosphodiesterase
MFWPGSETEIRGVRPSRWETFDPAVAPADRVDKVLSWLDLPVAERPRFLTLYFDQVDHAGHDFGPVSAGVDTALGAIDQAMARLVDGLKSRGLYDQINLVVVADHGMEATAPERVTYLDDLVDPQLVHTVTVGVLTSLSANAGHETEVETKLLGRHDHVACWRKGATPVYLHYGANPRVPPILCLADPGWQMYTRQGAADFAAKGQAFSLGQHGYDPTGPNMAALFIAHGPAFRAGAVQKPFDNVDVYPMLARLLAIKPEPNDGNLDDLAGILRP